MAAPTASADDQLVVLGNAVAGGNATIEQIITFLDLLVRQAVVEVNEQFAPRQLLKRERQVEPLPTNRREFSSYRTRLGTMLEYALSSQLDALIKSLFAADMRLTFAVAHDYPDFFLRDAQLEQAIRIEMKAVDADSEEQAARFEVLEALVKGEKDVVLIVGWQWLAAVENGVACEYPRIFTYVVVPAIELVRERDQSVTIKGGRVDAGGIWVPSKKVRGTLTPDPNNAGKLLRLVHESRRDAFDQSEYIRRFIQFTDEVTNRTRTATTRKRRRRGNGGQGKLPLE